MSDAQIMEIKQGFLQEIRSEYTLRRKRKAPETTGRVFIIENVPKKPGVGGVKGEEKWRECPFGEMEKGDAFLIAGKKTMVNSRLFLWALEYDKKRDRKFFITEDKGMVTCVRTE